jgi:hypothetical protein
MRKHLLPGFLALLDVIIITAVSILSVYIRFEGAAAERHLNLIVPKLPFAIAVYL